MSKEISKLVEEGTLTPISEMTLKHDNQEEFNEGFVYERGLPEFLTRGHFAMVAHNVSEPERCP